MRSSVISQYDFLYLFPQSPLGHRQRPFLFALQIEPAQMIFQTVTSAEPIFDGRPWSSRRPMVDLLEDLSRTENANGIGFGSEGAGVGVTKASEHQHPVCAEDCAPQLFRAEKH